MSPQLATLVAEAPSGPEWLHETKFDGFRILCRLQRGRATLFTRSGQDWTDQFPTVAAAAEALPVQNAWLDGELTMLADGRTSFEALQRRGLASAAGHQVTYFVFDLLHHDGRDLRPLPLQERKRALAKLLAKARGSVRYSPHIEGDGAAFLAKACQDGLEGIVSKQRGAPYVAGRGLTWVKAKCMKRQEFVIGGFTEPQGARGSLGAILVGVYEGKRLRYAGKVGTGFGHAAGADLRRRLDALTRASSPFSDPIKPLPRGVHWARPKLLAEVSFTEMTADGKLRHPSFKGLRDDKPATQVVREVPAPMPDAKPAAVTPVALTHPDRVLYPDVGLTKGDLAAYYQAVAPRILPHLLGRPLALVRCPAGTSKACFFMKHAPEGTAPALRRIALREKKASGAYLLVDSVEGLLALVQMSVLEIHTWGSTEAAIDTPDRLVFDLDPGPAVKWPHVVTAAQEVRERLAAVKLPSFLKTTGGKGLHVVVPLRPQVTWEAALGFTKALAEAMTTDEPRRYTTTIAKAGRDDKILIDYLRNQRGATAVAAFSTRARAGAPVSAPLDWKELDDFTPDQPVTVRSLPKRLAKPSNDPWRAYEDSRVPLPVSKKDH